jgi:hypothetical protein
VEIVVAAGFARLVEGGNEGLFRLKTPPARLPGAGALGRPYSPVQLADIGPEELALLPLPLVGRLKELEVGLAAVVEIIGVPERITDDGDPFDRLDEVGASGGWDRGGGREGGGMARGLGREMLFETIEGGVDAVG